MAPKFTGFVSDILDQTVRWRQHVRREPEETNHTVVELFCSLAKYVTREFKHPLRVAQSWFVKTMYKSALLTNILQRDNPGGLSNSGVREVIATAAALHVDAPGHDFMSRYQSHDVCISLDQSGDYGAGTSRASVLKRPNAGIHTVYIGRVATCTCSVARKR